MEKKNSCPSLTALEEYAVALRTGVPAREIGDHLAACTRCRDAMKSVQKEADSFLGFLQSVQETPPSPCPDAMVLAGYLDKSLDPELRKQIEQHVAICRPCQQMVKSIYNETDSSGARETEPGYVHAPAPEVLSDKKSTKRRLAAGRPTKRLAGDTADAEQRKKRLSSDFD
jgi:predicted anti-sigma-YlaC factor YlaD